MFLDSIKMSGLLGTAMLTPVLTSSTSQKSLPARLVNHTLGNERALRIAVLLVLEVRFVMVIPHVKLSKAMHELYVDFVTT